jgi:tetratricopeptide (TPR) repeat protein
MRPAPVKIAGMAAVITLGVFGVRAEAAPSSLPRVSDVAIQRGVTLGKEGDWRAAITALDEAIRAAPNSSDAYYLRGLAYAQLAGRDVDTASVLVPEGGHDYGAGASRLKMAIADLRKFLELSPGASQRAAVERVIGVYEDRVRQVVAAQAVLDERAEAARRLAAIAQAAIEKDLQDARVRSRTFKIAGLSTLGVGLGLVGIGVGETVASSNAESQISKGGFASSSDITAAVSSIQTQQGVSYAAYVVGGALIVTGGCLLLFGPAAPPATGKTALRVEGGHLAW